MNDAGSSWSNTSRCSWRERCTWGNGEFQQTISAEVSFSVSLKMWFFSVKISAVCQGIKGDRGAPGFKGERVSSISLQCKTVLNVNNVLTACHFFSYKGVAGEPGEPGQDVSNHFPFLVTCSINFLNRLVLSSWEPAACFLSCIDYHHFERGEQVFY